MVLLLAMVLYTHTAEKCIVAFKCSRASWTAPLQSLGALLLTHLKRWFLDSQWKGVPELGMGDTQKLRLGAKAGHGVHGERYFPSDELGDSKLNHQNVWEVSQTRVSYSNTLGEMGYRPVNGG